MPQDRGELTVEFRSPTRREFLSLALTTGEPVEVVSLELSLDVQLHGFTARCASWVERLAVVEFASALKTLEATRVGEAVLQGEDPEDLELKLAALDRVGHMLLEFKVTRLTLVGDRAHPVPVQLTGGFEVDPGLLPDLVARFDRLASLFTARR